MQGLISLESRLNNHSTKSVNIVAWNIEGLSSKLTEMGFLEYIYSFDVCCLMETFTSSDFDTGICFNDFIVLHSPGSKLSLRGRRSGGVMILVKKSDGICVTRLDTNSDMILALRLSAPYFQETIIVCLYVPPFDSPYYKGKDLSSTITVLDDLVLNYQERYPQAAIVICGDMNARIGSWDLHTESCDWFEDTDNNEPTCVCTNFISPRASKDKQVNTFGSQLKNFCQVHHAVILNGCTESDKAGQYTFISPHGDSVIDYCILIADYLPFTIDMLVGNRVESHHMPIEIVLGSPPSGVPSKRHRLDNCGVKLVWDNKKAEELKSQMETPKFVEQIGKASMEIDSSIDEAIAMCTGTLLSCAECLQRQIRPNCSLQKPRAPWYDKDCVEKRGLAIHALKRYRKCGTLDTKEQYMMDRRVYKSLIRLKKRTYFIDVRNNLMNNLHNSGVFWNIVKSSARRTNSLADISIRSWKSYFESMFQSFESPQIEGIDMQDRVTHDILDAKISSEEIKSALSRLKASKAPGLDGLPGGCYKTAGDKILPFLVKLFNKIYDTQYFPEAWSRSVIIPLHKKGDKLNTDNYRGISLLCAMSKIFASVLARRLRVWMEMENKVCVEQAGFRTQHSTVDHIFTLFAMISKYVYGDRRGKLYVTFVDYRKAFDSVDRTQLWEVLRAARLSTKFLQMLKAMYGKVQACVRWGQELSEFFVCPSGVKQGAVESPLIFSLYINTVADYVRRKGRHGVQMVPGMKEVFLLLFADDVVLISTTPVGLQNQLDNLQLISKSLNLKVNTDKTKVMVFRRGGHLASGEKWFLEGTRLEIANQYRYLGFIFTTKLSLDSALEDIAVRGKRKGVQVLKTLWNLRCMQTKVFTSLFDAQVQSSLLYGAEVWGLQRQQKVEGTHTFVCKKFLGVDPRTPNHMVYGDLGRFPLSVNSSVRVIKYWMRLSHMKIDRLPKQALIMLMSSCIKSGRNWAESVKSCLFRLGFGYAWLHGGVGDEKRFLTQLKQRLKDCYIQDWDAKNTCSDRYLWYSSFKQSFGLEEYLNMIEIKKFRDVMIRFRLGINELNNNKRYCSVMTTNCPWCEEREDEQHFLIRCPAYKQLREKFLVRYIAQKPDRIVCTQIMQGNTVQKLRSLAMYIFYAFRLREQKLNV